MAANNDEWVKGFRMKLEGKPRPTIAERLLGWLAAESLQKPPVSATEPGGGYGDPA